MGARMRWPGKGVGWRRRARIFAKETICYFWVFHEDGDRERRGNMALAREKECQGHRGRDSKPAEGVLRGGIGDS